MTVSPSTWSSATMSTSRSLFNTGSNKNSDSVIVLSTSDKRSCNNLMISCFSLVLFGTASVCPVTLTFCVVRNPTTAIRAFNLLLLLVITSSSPSAHLDPPDYSVIELFEHRLLLVPTSAHIARRLPPADHRSAGDYSENHTKHLQDHVSGYSPQKRRWDLACRVAHQR